MGTRVPRPSYPAIPRWIIERDLTELGLAVGGLRSVRRACGRPGPPCRVGLHPGLIPGTGLGSGGGLSLRIRLLV